MVTESVGTSGISSNLTASLALGSLNTTCVQPAPNSPSCTGNFGSPTGNGTFTLPFTLGQPFAFNVSVSDDSNGGGSTPHFGSGSVSLSFTLLEANGTTAVQVLTPEPASFGIFASGLLLLIGTGLRRYRSSR